MLTGLLSVNDEVVVSWIGRTPTAETDGALPSQTVTDPGYEILEFKIPNANLLEIAGGSLTASYRVGNRYSKSANATIIGQIVQLAALELEGAVNNTIDLAVVIQDPVTVSAPAYLGQKAGDRISIIWSGTTATGTPINYTFEYTVPEGGEADDIVFNVPRNNLEPLGGGKLLLSWQVVPAGSSNTVTSPMTTYNVTAAVLVLNPPIIKDAVGGRLDPMNAQTGTLFIAGYKGMRITDTIVPIWNGIFDTIPWALGDPSGAIESSVPPHMVAAVIGKTIDVTYEVLRDGEGKLSEVLKLTVEAIPVAELPTPKIGQASGDVLDVGALSADADVTVAAWPFIAPGQIMWMVLKGSTTEQLASWNGYTIGSANAQTTKIPLEYLQKLTDGSALELVLEVSFDGGATRQVFPVQRYTVTAKPAIVTPTITTVVDTNGAEIPNGGETTDTTVRFIGTATKNSPVLLYINYGGAMTATADAEGNWSITWRGLEVDSTHSFFATTIDEALRSNTWLIKVVALITVWDFNDHTFQGWTAQGPYTSLYGLESGVLMTDTPRGPNWQGNVISRTINVIAGKHYEFEFAAASITTAGRYSAALRFTINNSAIGQTVQVGSGWHKGTGSYTASRTEAVTLSIWNDTSSPDGNDFQIDYVSMRRSG